MKFKIGHVSHYFGPTIWLWYWVNYEKLNWGTSFLFYGINCTYWIRVKATIAWAGNFLSFFIVLYSFLDMSKIQALSKAVFMLKARNSEAEREDFR